MLSQEEIEAEIDEIIEEYGLESWIFNAIRELRRLRVHLALRDDNSEQQATRVVDQLVLVQRELIGLSELRLEEELRLGIEYAEGQASAYDYSTIPPSGDSD